MKLTEKNLVEGFTGITNGGDIISMVAGQKITWNYRTDELSRTDGYQPVCDPGWADNIYLENDRKGKIVIDHNDRPDCRKIVDAFDIAFGTAV